jgi:hypothetical protein
MQEDRRRATEAATGSVSGRICDAEGCLRE